MNLNWMTIVGIIIIIAGVAYLVMKRRARS